MVIAILIVLVGIVALLRLPIERYPQLSPPNVQVQAFYPGANAEIVEQSVATPIEQQVNGVDRMIYLRSLNSSDGRLSLNVTFEAGMDMDVANTLVQNRVAQAQSRLPQDVILQGVTVRKQNPSILMVVSLYSPNGTYDSLFLNNYAVLNVRDALQRVNGVSDVTLAGGAEYGMRIWVRPDELVRLELTPGDVIHALQEQNIQAPAGQIGAAPSKRGQEYTYTVRAPSRFSTPEQFGNVIVKSTPDGRLVRVSDVARVELGGEFYRSFGRVNGRDAGVLLIYLLPGANQVETANGLYQRLEELKRFFPQDVDYVIGYDTTPAVKAAIEGIIHTLAEAVLLVVLVVFIFLQNWRATLIPLLTVPVSLLGTFAVFPVLGFTLNTLTLFGLVLAIGIVVDDAIVVVEAVTHHIEEGMTPHDATVQAMKEVSGPVIGIALVLSSVFIPVAFLGGLTGRLYQQFALTIAIAVIISAFTALSLSPALSSLILKPPQEKRGWLARFFRGFNRLFTRSTNVYIRVATSLARRSFFSFLIILVVLLGAGAFAKIIPRGFIPEEDQGILLVNVQLPNAASLERTDHVCREIEEVFRKTAGVQSFNVIGGLSFIGGTFTPNTASFFLRLKPWDERKTRELSLQGITGKLMGQFAALPEAVVLAFAPPSLPGFGAAGGFNFILQDRSGSMSVQELGVNTRNFLAAAGKRPELQRLFTAFDPTVPQIAIDVDREKARTLGVPLTEVFATLQTSLGGAYVNDFNRFGRLYRVFVEAEADFRQRPSDIGQFYVRSATTNAMIPLSTLIKINSSSGTEMTMRYNLFRSVEITGSAAPGYSSAQALQALEEVAHQVLPPQMAYEYTGLSYQEKRAPNPVPTFVLAVVFVFLLLAALYESWSLPFSVLLGTPLVGLGAFLGVWLRKFDNNVFVQIGLVMLIGLAAKNAILIVEFAKVRREREGANSVDAAMQAARLRFRPIVMTALAFIFGVLPLMLASGSGANARRVMGTAVFFGMSVATIFGVLLVPSFFVAVERLRGKKKNPRSVRPPSTEGGSG